MRESAVLHCRREQILVRERPLLSVDAAFSQKWLYLVKHFMA